MVNRKAPVQQRRPLDWREGEPIAPLLEHEWLVANGIGGFASSTCAMLPSRRYHGLLVVAEPDGSRSVTVSLLEEAVQRQGARLETCALQVRLEDGLPVWELQFADVTLERRVVTAHRRNAVAVTHRVVAGDARGTTLQLRPWFDLRRLDDDVRRDVAAKPWMPAEGGFVVDRGD